MSEDLKQESRANLADNDNQVDDLRGKSERQAKSGQQLGIENAEKLHDYLAELKSKGACLPSNNGKADKSAIALACGFNRQTLYNNPEAVALLKQAIHDIGLEDGAAPSGGGKIEHVQRRLDQRDRRIQQLEEKLTTKEAEIAALRREKRELTEKLRQYEIFEEVMTANGRRFIP
ncbi:MAG TPA: hypothetical protein VF527_21055 [Pyrinomonadaceae bacterium]|jgi:chromosome condensin MukBEF ATPase and DNA-binding subunit MukB